MRTLICLLIAFAPLVSHAAGADANSPILGQWITDKKDLIVQVYIQGSEYRAKIVWAKDNTACPQNRLDDKNPNQQLRHRKIVGMDVLEGLTYNEKEARWENGHIYDATSGRTWRASAHFDDNAMLIVRGYWGFEIFGATLRFNRYK